MWYVQFLGQNEYKGEWHTIAGCIYRTEEEAQTRLATEIFDDTGYEYRVVKKES